LRNQYNEWYYKLFEKIDEKGKKFLLNKFISKGFEEALLSYFKEESASPFSNSYQFYSECVNEFVENINETKKSTLSNLPIIYEDQKSIYIEDLNKRSAANKKIKDLISKEVDFPYSFYDGRGTRWVKQLFEDIGMMGIGIAISYIYPPAELVISAVYETFNTVKKLNEDARLVAMVSETFSDMYVKSKKIKDNTLSGISQIKDGKIPVIPKIEVLEIKDISEGYYRLKWWFIEKKSYTLIDVKNNGNTPATVWVVEYFSNGIEKGSFEYESNAGSTAAVVWGVSKVIDGGRIRLDPGETKRFRVEYVGPYFEYKPDYGDSITTLVFSETEDGTYLVEDYQRDFYPVRLNTLNQARSTYNKIFLVSNETNSAEDEDITVISNPIKIVLAKLNMTTYEVIIMATNPFPYPINAEITHNTNSWNISIPPRETKILNYTIRPLLGVENTLPPAYMTYFDFQYNETIQFVSDDINFTPSGIEIEGFLPYNINKYTKVNLSITNLVNITNGTFSLKLIGNRTFEYNVTANIENISALSVEFGPIDIPDGNYTSILTFVYNDKELPIDRRIMSTDYTSCVPYDLDNNHVIDIFDVVAGLEYLSGERNESEIFNKECSGRISEKFDFIDLLTLISKIGTDEI